MDYAGLFNSRGLVVFALIGIAGGLTQYSEAGRKKRMKTVVNHLGVELSVTPSVAQSADLRVTVTLTNESTRSIRLNAQYFATPSLALKFVDANGAAVPTGPPPVPYDDDGKRGRVDLSPGKPIRHVFEGNLIFGNPLDPGRYSVSFRYINDPVYPGEWVGTIETPRAPFEVARPKY